MNQNMTIQKCPQCGVELPIVDKVGNQNFILAHINEVMKMVCKRCKSSEDITKGNQQTKRRVGWGFPS